MDQRFISSVLSDCFGQENAETVFPTLNKCTEINHTMTVDHPTHSRQRFALHDRLPYLSEHPRLEAHHNVGFQKGEALFTHGATSPFVYIVVKGYVKLVSYTKDREVLEDYYQAGDIVNIAQLFGPIQPKYAALAMSKKAIIRKIPAPVFRQYTQEDPTLLDLTLQIADEALERTRDRLRRLTVLHSNDRVVDFLATFAQQAGKRVGYEWVIYGTPTHGDIGLITCTSRQTVTTVLNDLRRIGLIDFNRKNMIIRDMHALAAYRFKG
jgi:CRP-like cAMP-binding protein